MSYLSHSLWMGMISIDAQKENIRTEWNILFIVFVTRWQFLGFVMAKRKQVTPHDIDKRYGFLYLYYIFIDQFHVEWLFIYTYISFDGSYAFGLCNGIENMFLFYFPCPQLFWSENGESKKWEAKGKENSKNKHIRWW